MGHFIPVFWVFLCAAAGIGPWLAWREGYDAGRRRQRRESVSVDGRRFVKALAAVMEVQADGGDSPEAYVAWAVKEAEKIARNEA